MVYGLSVGPAAKVQTVWTEGLTEGIGVQTLKKLKDKSKKATRFKPGEKVEPDPLKDEVVTSENGFTYTAKRTKQAIKLLPEVEQHQPSQLGPSDNVLDSVDSVFIKKLTPEEITRANMQFPKSRGVASYTTGGPPLLQVLSEVGFNAQCIKTVRDAYDRMYNESFKQVLQSSIRIAGSRITLVLDNRA
jgi:hypothetical protein